MPELSRAQLVVYGAIAVALLLVGARWVRSADGGSADRGGIAEAAVGGGGAEGAFAIEGGGGGDAVVHVAGAVREPGVYRLPSGSRVTDAIERAGGPAADAAPDGINLAARVSDGQQVIMPARAAGPGGVGAGTGVAAAAAAEGPISLGSATVEQLDTIEGIGPVTAQDIIAFRDERGGLSSIEELDEVTGIGPATMEALRDRLQP
ncbi:MAG: helix-hairpin-helix domain-containing protein [Solirubrobacterales bacterium]